MGHYEKRERPEIREKINKCKDLKSKLEQHKNTATADKGAASDSKDSCHEIVYTETENLSGLYHEENHMNYRDAFFEKIDSLIGSAETMISAVEKIISDLDAKISELELELYEEVWVLDESDYYNGSSEAS